MHHYERENAKEWQLNLGSKPKAKAIAHTSSGEGSDEEVSWTRVQSSRRFPDEQIYIDLSSSSRQQNIHSTKGPQSAGLPTRPVLKAQANRGVVKGRVPTKITFAEKEDNAARNAFRRGRRHDSEYVLKHTCEKIEPDRVKMYRRLEEIGVRFGTFIRPPQFLLDRTLLLWGSEDQIRRTKAELSDWIQKVTPEIPGPRDSTLMKAKKDGFPKTGELQSKRERAADAKLKEDAEKQKYQRDPQEGQKFPFRGYFLWPTEEVKPEELLGPSFEAYDSIRTFNAAHITFDVKLSCFKILSNTEDAIQQILQRIEGTMREYVARSGKFYSMILISFPKASRMCKAIRMLPGPGLASRPFLTGEPLSDDEVRQFEEQKIATELADRKKMQRALGKVILRLPFYRGNVCMRVFFGVFTFTTFRWPEGASSVPFRSFLSDITMPATRGTLTGS